MISISRRDFIKAGFAFAISPTFIYESPNVTVVSLSSLDVIEPFANSFADMSTYNHALNCFPQNANSSYWGHIYKESHNIDYESKEYWDAQILAMVRSSANYLGECRKGTAPNCKVILGYSLDLSDGSQLWAEVTKVTNTISDAGRNYERWAWGANGFENYEVSCMNLREMTYEAIRQSVYKGALTLGKSVFDEDGNVNLIGIFWALGERNSMWQGGGSDDPAIYEEYCELYDEAFAAVAPDAENTYELAIRYLIKYEHGILWDLPEGEETLVPCFKAGISFDVWKKTFDDFSYNLVEI